MATEMGTRMFRAPDDPGSAIQTNGNGQPDVKPEQTPSTGNGAAATPAWMAQLPGDLKSDEKLKTYPTLGDAVRGLMEAGKEPQQEKAPQKYRDFAKRLDENEDPLGDITGGIVEFMQSKGIPQADAEEFFDSMNGTFRGARDNLLNKGREICEKEVRRRWGTEYDSKRALMARGYQAMGDTDGSLQKALDASGASLVPEVWEMLARVGAMVREDGGSPARGTGGQSSLPYGVPVDYSRPSR